MVRIRLRVNGDARSGLFVGVGSGTDYPNIHKLCEAIARQHPLPGPFVQPEHGLESVWAAAAIDFFMNAAGRPQAPHMSPSTPLTVACHVGRFLVRPEGVS